LQGSRPAGAKRAPERARRAGRPRGEHGAELRRYEPRIIALSRAL